MEGHRDPDQPVEELPRTLEEELARIRRLGLVIVAAMVLIGGPVIALGVLTANKAYDNSTHIRQTERQDRNALRAAAWRGCARSMLERADAYAAQRAFLTLPAVRQVFSERLIAESVERRRRNLPVLNCDPNLCGTPPTLLVRGLHDAFVNAYEKGDLVANPAPPPLRAWVCPAPLVPYQLSASR